jgi:5,10-methylenetetrahydromethanopterin reductase
MFPSAPAGALVDAIVAADELGLDEVWLADEGVAREPVPVLSAAAARTSRIRLATGITSPVLRHPGAIASTMATLDELSDGRAVLGLGVGGHLALEPFGLQVERPVALVRDAIATARAVFGRVGSAGYRPPPHAMPARDVPIWIGARGPQIVRAAARLADGLFVSGCTSAQHDEIVANAESVGGTKYALYQSASSDPDHPTELSWDDVHLLLGSELRRLRPASVGVSLVDLARHSDGDPTALVERAAALLAAL